MGKLVFLNNDRLVTDSLLVAERFGKDHRRVMQDVRELECSNEFREHHFVLSSYVSIQNKELPKYLMDYDGFSFLVMGYTGKDAARFKEEYIKEFNHMKDELNNTPTQALPQNYKEALLALVGEVEKNERLQLENEELRSKVKYVDQILMSKGTMTITQIAKDYGLSGPQLNKILHQEKVQYKQNRQWLLYQKHSDKGYTRSETIDITRSDGSPDVTLNTRWTQKGRLFIHEILTKRNIIPYMDRQSA